jgi:hypothetical protein
VRCVALLALVGCSFGAPRASSETSDTPGGPFCGQAGVVACYEFEGATADGTANHLDGTMTNVTFVSGKRGMALRSDTTSAVDVADSALFDVAALTVEAWIYPTQLPATGERMGILDADGQYGFFLYESGRLQCTSGGSSNQIDANVPANQWTHVACIYDGANRRIYVDGGLISETTGGALSTGGTTGITIAGNNPPGSGARLVGMIDQMRLWSRALTDVEIVAASQ